MVPPPERQPDLGSSSGRNLPARRCRQEISHYILTNYLAFTIRGVTWACLVVFAILDGLFESDTDVNFPLVFQVLAPTSAALVFFVSGLS